MAARPVLEWRGAFGNDELNALHAECFGHPVLGDDWWGQVNRFSLGWVCLRLDGRLAGFVNVAWDGGVHAFLLDTAVTPSLRRQGHATRLVREAVARARAAGCEWLHVDFDPELRGFYLDACGFRPTEAGLVRLR
ncbi:GNAT family N-acetyltransferase [Inquilinus limosus]|uniref:GNAT family N-acetyltransferase n=1 Tax=Inquilinus limosus TaxID=171674 RepID=A0A211ZNF5_9PROT|nr:GNAT family N-acetyltransferase [Inquilinus limosus]OWJ66805.1 GNAT family N-acetyltransferase [Inquilinus limosus]